MPKSPDDKKLDLKKQPTLNPILGANSGLSSFSSHNSSSGCCPNAISGGSPAPILSAFAQSRVSLSSYPSLTPPPLDSDIEGSGFPKLSDSNFMKMRDLS